MSSFELPILKPQAAPAEPKRTATYPAEVQREEAESAASADGEIGDARAMLNALDARDALLARFHASQQPLQTALEVSEPGDELEQEAEQVADRVMRMAEPSGSSGGDQEEDETKRGPMVQRACAKCETEEEDDERKMVHRDAEGAAPSVGAGFESGLTASRAGGGEALPAGVRSFMEPRFGLDFGDVRVHRDAAASALTEDVKAKAFTVGSDVFFREGHFEPGTESGQHLLAHELTHVVQQREGMRSVQREILQREVAPPGAASDSVPRAVVEQHGDTIVVTIGGQSIAEGEGHDGMGVVEVQQPTTPSDAIAIRIIARDGATVLPAPDAEEVLKALAPSYVLEILEARVIPGQEMSPPNLTRVALISHVAPKRQAASALGEMGSRPIIMMPPAGGVVTSPAARKPSTAKSPHPKPVVPSPVAATPSEGAAPAPQAPTSPAAKPVAREQVDPASFIDAHTSLLNLDEEALGRDLVESASRADLAFIKRVLDELSQTDRDDVALEFMLALQPDLLKTLASSEPGRDLLDRLFDELTSGSVSGDEKAEADRIVEAKPVGTSPAEFDKMVATGGLKIFPFRLPGPTVTNPAGINARVLGNGFVQVSVLVQVLADYKEEARTLGGDVTGSGIRLRADELVGVRLYDTGGNLAVVPALRLVELSNQNDQKTVEKILEVSAIAATLGTGALAAGGVEGSLAVRGLTSVGVRASTAARIVLYADRAAFALGVMTSVIGEHRGWILEEFGDDGAKFLQSVDVLNSAIFIYGGARLLSEAPRVVLSFRDAYRRWRALAEASKGTMDAERRAALEAITREADELLKNAEEAEAATRQAPAKAASGGAEPTAAGKPSQPSGTEPPTPAPQQIELPRAEAAGLEPPREAVPAGSRPEPVPKAKAPGEKPVRPAVPVRAAGKPPPGFEPPKPPKPLRGTPEGDAWRYQRYKYEWWKSPQESRPPLKSAEEYAAANFQGGRGGGPNQRATRRSLEHGEGYVNTETQQLGTRVENGKIVKNMVDMVKPGGSEAGGIRYVEADSMSNAGKPTPPMIEKLKAELAALKPGEDLLFVDSNNSARRILYRYGEKASVVDTRTGPQLPRRPPRKPIP